MSYFLITSIVVLSLIGTAGLAYFYVLPIFSVNPECKSLSLDAEDCINLIAQRNQQTNLTYSTESNVFMETVVSSPNSEIKQNFTANVSEDRAVNKTRIKVSATNLGLFSYLGTNTETMYFFLPQGNFTCTKYLGQNYSCSRSYWNYYSVLGFASPQTLISYVKTLNNSSAVTVEYQGTKSFSVRTCD